MRARVREPPGVYHESRGEAEKSQYHYSGKTGEGFVTKFAKILFWIQLSLIVVGLFLFGGYLALVAELDLTGENRGSTYVRSSRTESTRKVCLVSISLTWRAAVVAGDRSIFQGRFPNGTALALVEVVPI